MNICPRCATAVSLDEYGNVASHKATNTQHVFALCEGSGERPGIALFRCPPEQTKGTCEPFEDPKAHNFRGWEEFDEGRGGTTVCTRCGISAFSHAMRYAP